MSVNILILSTLFFQFLGVTTHPSRQRISAGVGDPNGYAALLDVLIPLAIYRALNVSGIRRVLYLAIIIALTVLLMLTGSRGGYLGFVAAACVLLYHYGTRRILAVTVLTVCIAGTVYFAAPDLFWQRADSITVSQKRDSSIDLRLGHYRAALLMFLDHPLTGVGIGNFRLNNLKYGDVRSQVVHDTYLEVLTGGGLLSLIPFLMIELTCWRSLSIKECNEKALSDLLICLKASFASLLTTGLFLSAAYDKTLWFSFSLISSAYYAIPSKMELCTF
ncbi:MAG: O-antigen ligase family protein [Sedimentisphaerales bacterium]